MNVTRFFARNDIVVVGSNPEMADYVNPRGAIFGHAAFVVAENARGDRRALHVATDLSKAEAMTKAEKLAERLNARLASGKLPVGFAAWTEDRPAYGSDAYIEYGADDDIAMERREADDERWGFQ